MRRQTWQQPATQRTSYYWSAGNAQKDSWQTIHPRDYFVFPREGKETSDHYAGMRLKYKPVYPAPALPIHWIARATAAHSTPPPRRNKATLFLNMRVERERHPPYKWPTRQARPSLTSQLPDWL